MSFPATGGWPPAFNAQGQALLKQVMHFGNKAFKESYVFSANIADSGIKASGSLRVLQAVQIDGYAHFNLLALVVDGPITRINELARPGVQKVAQFVGGTLGAVLDSSTQVLGTVVLANPGKTEALDGVLHVSNELSDFQFDLNFVHLAVAIAAERVILERATEATFSESFLAITARMHSNSLSNWLTFPSSDSTAILESVKLLRSSLLIDERKQQVLASLESQIRASNLSLAAFVAVAGVCFTGMSTVSDLFPAGTDGSWLKVFFAGAVSGLVSLFTWLAVRKR